MDYYFQSQLVAAIVGAIIAGLISLFIFWRNNKRVRLDFLISSWQNWDAINYIALQDEENLKAFFSVMYGDKVFTSEEMRRDQFILLIMNNAYRHWVGMKEGFVSERAAKDYVISGLIDIQGQKERALVLLDQGGYEDEEFVAYVKREFPKLKAHVE